MSVHPDYAYWSNALAGTLGPVSDGHPQCGFYRRRPAKDAAFVPVAIWRGEDGMVALVNGKSADASDIWTWVCDKPITEVEYHKVMGGGDWSDEPRAAAVARNMPTDPFEALTIEFAAEMEVAAELLAKPVSEKNHADQIAVLTKRLSAIKNRATDLHKVEKQPSLDEGRKVDTKWRDLKEEPDALGKKLKRHLDAYLIEQQRQRAAREDAARIQREADETAAAAIEECNAEAAAKADRLQQEAAAASRQAEARSASAGRTGAKVSLRSYAVPVITDFDTLLMALKDRPEIRECVETLANRAAKSGVELPGMSITQEQRAA